MRHLGMWMIVVGAIIGNVASFYAGRTSALREMQPALDRINAALDARAH